MITHVWLKGLSGTSKHVGATLLLALSLSHIHSDVVSTHDSGVLRFLFFVVEVLSTAHTFLHPHVARKKKTRIPIFLCGNLPHFTGMHKIMRVPTATKNTPLNRGF